MRTEKTIEQHLIHEDSSRAAFILSLSVSLLTHALVAGFLYTARPFTAGAPPVFSVDIVPPLEDTAPAREPEAPAPAIRQAAPPPVQKRPMPPKREDPPKTLSGDSPVALPEESIEAVPDRKTTPAGEERDPVDTARSSLPAPHSGGGDLQGTGDALPLVPRSSLFDRKTIEEFARKGAPENKGLTFDTAGFQNRGYMRMLKDRIETIWKYPREAARHGISGDLYMKFSINRDGSLHEVELLRTSGYRELDEAAMNAVKKAQPFWPLPDDWEKDTLEIKGHFIYVFGNALIM
ncbi:MAG: energy transducer TonB [Nitrospiraceae bacterium]|nr:MAG: energy transducer TonB [Nitrospiraceae bacterium]